jgi:hypothetical protein
MAPTNRTQIGSFARRLVMLEHADSRASSTTCMLFAPVCWGYWKILLIFLTLSKAL